MGFPAKKREMALLNVEGALITVTITRNQRNYTALGDGTHEQEWTLRPLNLREDPGTYGPGRHSPPQVSDAIDIRFGCRPKGDAGPRVAATGQGVARWRAE